MGKFIALLVIVAALFWAYSNGYFANFKGNATNTFMQEKTIKKFHQAQDQNNEATQKAVEGF